MKENFKTNLVLKLVKHVLVVLIKTRPAQTSFAKHASLDGIKTKQVKLLAKNVLWDNSELLLSQLTEYRQPLRFSWDCRAHHAVLEDTLEPNICRCATLVKKVNIKNKRERQHAKIVLPASIKTRTCSALSLDAKIVVPGCSVLSPRKLLVITAQEGNFELEERVLAHLLAHVQSVL